MVAVLSLGGTISMTIAQAEGAALPTLGADDLTRQLAHHLPGVAVSATTLAKLGSSQLRVLDAWKVLASAQTAVDSGARGVVVVQGTDTLEETAFLLDLLWNRPEPLVFTGAMRRPGDAGAEGLGNIAAAVLVASDEALRDEGVLVVMNDEVHLARHVAKQDANALQAFGSPPWGPVARVLEGRIHLAHRRSGRPPRLPVRTGEPIRIPVLVATFDDDGTSVDAVAERSPQGIIIAAMGAGHVPVPMADAAERAVTAGIPVVFATRTGAGSTTLATYGYPGSEADLLARGLIGAGWLNPLKARLLLYLLICAGADLERIRQEFAARGQA